MAEARLSLLTMGGLDPAMVNEVIPSKPKRR
jgi:hypothetical protein